MSALVSAVMAVTRVEARPEGGTVYLVQYVRTELRGEGRVDMFEPLVRVGCVSVGS
jgi:hypothetical protein